MVFRSILTTSPNGFWYLVLILTFSFLRKQLLPSSKIGSHQVLERREQLDCELQVLQVCQTQVFVVHELLSVVVDLPG